jgi:hypothetical protein
VEGKEELKNHKKGRNGKTTGSPGVVGHACNPRALEA